MDANQLQAAAEAGLAAMRAAGFDQAQVTAGVLDLSELNANDNAASMLRSTETTRCTLLGIVDGRMASTELADLSAEAVRVGSSRVDLQACKLEYSIVSPK